MEDDELLYDVYGDLETFDMGEKLKEVNKEVAELGKRLNDALDKLTVLRTENKRLSSESKVLRANNASLLLTANNELRRKDTEIQTLRREKEDICFRRNITAKPPPKPSVSAVCIQTDITFSNGDQVDILRHGQTSLVLNVLPAAARQHHHRHHHLEQPQLVPKADIPTDGHDRPHHRTTVKNASHQRRHPKRPIACDDMIKSSKNPFHRRRSAERKDRDQRAAEIRTGGDDGVYHHRLHRERTILPVKRVRNDEVSQHPPIKRTRTNERVKADDADARSERVRRAEKHMDGRSKSRESSKSCGDKSKATDTIGDTKSDRKLANGESDQERLLDLDNATTDSKDASKHLISDVRSVQIERLDPDAVRSKSRTNCLNGDHQNTVDTAPSLSPCEVQLVRVDAIPGAEVKPTERSQATTKPDKPKTTQRRSHEKKASNHNKTSSHCGSRDIRHVDLQQVLSKKIKQLFGTSSDEQSPAKVSPADCQSNAIGKTVEPTTPCRDDASRPNLNICETPLSSLATHMFAERDDNRTAASTHFQAPMAAVPPPTTSSGSAVTSPGNCSTASSTTLYIAAEDVDQIELCIGSNHIAVRRDPIESIIGVRPPSPSIVAPPPLPTSPPPPPPPQPPPAPSTSAAAERLDVTVMEELPMDIDYELTTTTKNSESQPTCNAHGVRNLNALETPRQSTASPFAAIADSGSLITSGETVSTRIDGKTTTTTLIPATSVVLALLNDNVKSSGSATPSAAVNATEPSTPQPMTTTNTTATTTKARLSDQSFMREMLTTETANISGENLQRSQHDESVLLAESQSSSGLQPQFPSVLRPVSRPHSPYEDYSVVRDISSLSEFCAPATSGLPKTLNNSRSAADAVRELLDTLGRTPEHFDDPPGPMLLPSQSPAGPIGEDELLASEMQLNLSVTKLLLGSAAGHHNDSLNSSGEQRRIHSTSRMSWYVMEDAAAAADVSGGANVAEVDDDGDGPLMVLTRKKRHRSRKSGHLVK